MRQPKLSKHGVFKQAVLGFVLGLLITPQGAVHAFPVYDAPNHSTQLTRMAQDAARWVETVKKYTEQFRKYQTMIDKQVEQIQSLGGILKTVDEQLARNKRWVSDIALIGKTVRDALHLERQLRNMVTCQIRSIKSIHDRLRAGIFNPAQNRRDLEEYLRHTIGKSSQDVIDHQIYLAKMDVEYNEILYQIEVTWAEMAAVAEKRKQLEEQLAEERSKPAADQQVVIALTGEIAQCDVRYDELTKRLIDLKQRAHQKIIAYGVVLEEHIDFAKIVERDMKFFQEMTALNEKVMEELEKAFDPNAEQELDPVDGEFTDQFYGR